MEFLFATSYMNHQDIIDILLKHQQKDGYCYILKKDINIELNKLSKNRSRSYTWLQKAIKRINYLNVVIEEKDIGVFKVHYDTLLENSVFSVVFSIMSDIVSNTELITKSDFELMDRYQVDRKVISMVRAYLMSG